MTMLGELDFLALRPTDLVVLGIAALTLLIYVARRHR
jgi:hypothetical protein